MQLNESGNLSPSVISTIVLTLRTEYNRTGVLKLLWIVVLLQEYNLRLNAVPIDTNDRIRLANAHFEIWMRSGVSAHISHLESAIEHFKSAFATGFRQEWLNDYLVYFKALQMIGDHEAAEDLIKGLLPWYENQACYPNILFYAGVAHKASKKLDAANGYFFEASQLGPPKLFSKLEMMVIISRIIEEGGGDDDGNDEAYRMVHAHLAMEGHISSQVDYDDWISDGKTWLNLADKCSLHHMFSLAADFYALAITRDFDAFRKPMLWYRFAKSCRMCGRIADAQLAVKVSWNSLLCVLDD